MKSYIKFAIFEVIIVLLLFLFTSFMIHISNNGDGFIPNRITVYLLVPYASLFIFGILMYKLSTIRATSKKEIFMFAVLNLILGVALILFLILLDCGIIRNSNYFYFWHKYGKGRSLILAGFNIAYSFKSFREYIRNKKITINNAQDNEGTN